MINRLRLLFNLQPGEGARVVVMLLYSAAAMGGVLTVGQAVAAALFVSALPPSAVPYLFILPPLVIVPALVMYNRVANRFRLDQMILGSNVLLLVGTVIFRIALDAPYGNSFAVRAALNLFVDVAYTMVILQFWSVAGHIFNPREARRLFGLIAAGGTLANVAAGLSLMVLVRLIGVENLLWLVALALLICMASAYALRRWQEHTPAAPQIRNAKRSQKRFLQDLREIGRSPLLRAIGGLTILLSLLINIGAYLFYLALQHHFAGREAELTAYLGAYEAWAGGVAFVVQFSLTGWVMTRFGISTALLFFPLGTALGAGLSLLTGGALWAITLIRAADPVFRRTINSAALGLLYLPVPIHLRERARELFESLYAATFGLAGVVFLLLLRVPGWDYRAYHLPMLALAALTVVLIGWTRRQYTRTLADSLRQRVLDLEGATIDVADETTVRILAETLRHPDALLVLHALQLIASAPAVNWDVHVAPLLAHPSAVVRIAALRHLARGGIGGHLESVAALLGAPEADVRAAAIETLCAVTGREAVHRAASSLADPDPRVKGVAVAGLIQHGDRDDAQRAAAELQRMIGSDDPAMRSEGARIIGVVRSPELYAPLAALFDDASRAVRLSAIRAAGELNSRELLPHLIHALNDHATAPAAVQALAKYRGEIEPELGAALDDPAVGASIPRILEQRRTRPAVDLLLAHFRAPDDIVRGEVYKALARLRSAGVAFDLPEPALHAAIADELRAGYTWIMLRTDLRAEGLDPLLADAIQVRLSRTLDRAFCLLTLLYPGSVQPIQRVRKVLETEVGSVRARAIEFLDTLAERQVKELLIPLLEAPVERLLTIARGRLTIRSRSLPERLAELAHSTDPWLRVCASFRIGMLRRTELAHVVLAALASDEALLRETALAACRALFDAQRFSQLLEAHHADIGVPIASRYARAQQGVSDTRLMVPTPIAQPLASTNGGAMPLSTIERVLLLKGAELFNGIAGEDLVPVALVAEEVHFTAGEVLIRQGEPGDCLYIVVDGEVSIAIRGVGTVATRGAKSSIGEMGVISHHPRSADCVALTDVTALRIDRTDFWELLGEQPALGLGVISVLSQRLDEAVANLARHDQLRGPGQA